MPYLLLFSLSALSPISHVCNYHHHHSTTTFIPTFNSQRHHTKATLPPIVFCVLHPFPIMTYSHPFIRTITQCRSVSLPCKHAHTRTPHCSGVKECIGDAVRDDEVWAELEGGDLTTLSYCSR
ncbi:hypothetical protein E2C01_003998 [Portunus trituberculatus]|uniref:Secreted protein n=1 Tax=Portunus trituberculatus TaxID=210409 RepID=A0A5B7CQ69_PORTR|nr:hypothetical protein [Portunus trituberculatus]